jgi:hypothetical protein
MRDLLQPNNVQTITVIWGVFTQNLKFNYPYQSSNYKLLTVVGF